MHLGHEWPNVASDFPCVGRIFDSEDTRESSPWVVEEHIQDCDTSFCVFSTTASA